MATIVTKHQTTLKLRVVMNKPHRQFYLRVDEFKNLNELKDALTALGLLMVENVEATLILGWVPLFPQFLQRVLDLEPANSDRLLGKRCKVLKAG